VGASENAAEVGELAIVLGAARRAARERERIRLGGSVVDVSDAAETVRAGDDGALEVMFAHSG